MMTTNYELSMEALNLVVGGTGEVGTVDSVAWRPPFHEADDPFEPGNGIPRGGKLGIRV